MAQVSLVTDAQATPVQLEMEGATPIVPLKAVALHVAVQTTDEWPDIEPPPEGSILLALHPALAKELAHAMLAAVQKLENSR